MAEENVLAETATAPVEVAEVSEAYPIVVLLLPD